jgi:hypothetical protein
MFTACQPISSRAYGCRRRSRDHWPADMQGEIAHISVIWAEHTSQGTRFRIYDVLPDDEKIIRAERMEELVDDLSLICRQLQEARDRMPTTTATTGTGRVIRRIK